jgi:hypothetical protein
VGDERIKALRRAWLRAAEDLGIRVSVEGLLDDQRGVRLTYAVLVEDFGSVEGMLLWPHDEPYPGQTEVATERGYGFSYLSPTYESYDRDAFIDALNDWGWSGAGKPPDWYTGDPRGE